MEEEEGMPKPMGLPPMYDEDGNPRRSTAHLYKVYTNDTPAVVGGETGEMTLLSHLQAMQLAMEMREYTSSDDDEEDVGNPQPPCDLPEVVLHYNRIVPNSETDYYVQSREK
jgi:hypothetical protein